MHRADVNDGDLGLENVEGVTCAPDETCELDTCGFFGTCFVEAGEAICACDPGHEGPACGSCVSGFEMSPGGCVAADLTTPLPEAAARPAQYGAPCWDGSDCATEIPMTGFAPFEFEELDIVMRQFMKWRSVGAGVLTVARNGRTIYKRGFGRMAGPAAEISGYTAPGDTVISSEFVQPSTPMVVGSVAKYLTAILVRDAIAHRLVETEHEAAMYAGTTNLMAPEDIPYDRIESLRLLDETAQLLPPHLMDVLSGAAMPRGGNIVDDGFTCQRTGGAEGADIRWQQVTIGQLLGHMAGLPKSAPSWTQQVVPRLAALRGYDDPSDWASEHGRLAQEWGDEMADAEAEIRPTLAMSPEDELYFVERWPQGAKSFEEWFEVVAGRCLARDPGAETDDSSDRYSNTGFSLLAYVAEYLTDNTLSAPVGNPEEYVGSQLHALMSEVGIPYGVESDAGIGTFQAASWIPGYESPVPVRRHWDATAQTYSPDGIPQQRPFCVQRGNEPCDFGAWMGAHEGTYNRSIARGWSFGSNTPFWAAGDGMNPGTGLLRVEGPAMMRLLQDYLAGNEEDSPAIGRKRGNVSDIMLKGGMAPGARSYIMQLGQKTKTLDLPPLDHNGRLTDDFGAMSGNSVTFTQPGGVDVFVAVEQSFDHRCPSGGCVSWYAALRDFVRYGLSRVDWDAVDRLMDHQSRWLVGMDIDNSGNTHYWSGDDVRRVGLGNPMEHGREELGDGNTFESASSRTSHDVASMGIATDNDVYVWYMDGHVGYGTSTDQTYRTPHRYYTLGNRPYHEIAGIAISSHDRVYTWYRDGTRSWGNSTYLASVGHGSYTAAPDQHLYELRDVAIASDYDDHCFALYADGSVSEGWSGDLDAYGYVRGKVSGLDMDNEGNTRIWYANGYYRIMQGTLEQNFGRPSSTTKSGFYSLADGTEHAELADLAVDGNGQLYALTSDGSIASGQRSDNLSQGVGSLPLPSGQVSWDQLVGFAKAEDGTTYTWWKDGSVASRKLAPLTRWNTTNYLMPPGRARGEIAGIGVQKSGSSAGTVWVLYSDGSISWGTPTDLDADGYRNMNGGADAGGPLLP